MYLELEMPLMDGAVVLIVRNSPLSTIKPPVARKEKLDG